MSRGTMMRRFKHRIELDALKAKTLPPRSRSCPRFPAAGSARRRRPRVQAMQQDASSNNNELCCGNGDDPGYRDRCAAIRRTTARDHRDAGFQLRTLADTRGVILPSSLSTSDQAMALQFFTSAVGSGTANFDQNFLNMMVQMHTQTIATFQQQLATATDPGFQAFLSPASPSSSST